MVKDIKVQTLRARLRERDIDIVEALERLSLPSGMLADYIRDGLRETLRSKGLMGERDYTIDDVSTGIEGRNFE